MTNATALIDGLGGEKVRWTEQSRMFEQQINKYVMLFSDAHPSPLEIPICICIPLHYFVFISTGFMIVSFISPSFISTSFATFKSLFAA